MYAGRGLVELLVIFVIISQIEGINVPDTRCLPEAAQLDLGKVSVMELKISLLRESLFISSKFPQHQLLCLYFVLCEIIQPI